MQPTESPWLVILACSIAGAVLVSLAAQRGSWKLALGAAACILAAGGAVVIDVLVETDRERVERYVVSTVRAFERGDLPALLEHFSQRAVCERKLAEFAVGVVTVEHPLSIKDVRVELQNEDSIATSTFRANGEVAVRGRNFGHHPSQWRLTWRKEGGDWRIIRIQELDPLHSEPLDRLGRIGATLCP